MDMCTHNVHRVLTKREVQHAVLTGIELDILAEKNQLSEPLLNIIKRDEGLYGIDEVIAYSIVKVYGSLGITSSGYIDKQKPGILKELSDLSTRKVNTFIDDIAAAVAADAANGL